MNVEEKTPYQKEREDYQRRLARLEEVDNLISTYQTEWFGSADEVGQLVNEKARLEAYFERYEESRVEEQAEEEYERQ